MKPLLQIAQLTSFSSCADVDDDLNAYTDYDDLFADAHAKPDFPVGILLTCIGRQPGSNRGVARSEIRREFLSKKIRREMEKWCRGVQIKLSDSGKNTKAMEAFR